MFSRLLLLLAVTFCRGQMPMQRLTNVVAGDACTMQGLQRACSNCITNSPDCVWCPYPFGIRADPHCRNHTSNDDLPCEGVNGTALEVEDPENMLNITQDDNFGRVGNQSINQVRPQAINITLRIDSPQMFNISILPAVNSPLDVYFLFDLSASLTDDLTSFNNLIENITFVLEDLSPDFTMGFGSFVDKRTLPYAIMNYTDRKGECSNNRPVCTPTYSYQHVLGLTRNRTTFQNVVSEVTISANVDAPEGCLDALLQATACPRLIGWRDSALHLLVLITDNAYHAAGDGKLGGVVVPNDGECRLTKNDNLKLFEYLEDTFYDYPSIALVNQRLNENEVIPIFTVPAGFLSAYQTLRENLDSANVAENLEDSSDLANVIRTAHSEVTRRVELRPLNAPPALQFNFQAIEGCDTVVDNGCDNVERNRTEPVVFKATITMTNCPPEFQGVNLNIVIRIPGYGRVNLLLNPICECSCEDNAVANSSHCNNSGSLECGICRCNEGRQGLFCQCEDPGSTSCPMGRVGSGETLPCSGRGLCDDCGDCFCEEDTERLGLLDFYRYFGEACQCDGNSCEKGLSNYLCSGEDHGFCDCTTKLCKCNGTAPLSNASYFGKACECSPDDCFSPANPETLCYNVEDPTNHGNCTCGFCQCPPGLVFRDNVCTLPILFCSSNEECVRCTVGGSSLAGVSDESICSTCNVEKYDIVRINRNNLEERNFTDCDYTDGDNCEHIFYVPPDGSAESVMIDEGRSCPTNDLPWIISISLIGGILLLGLLLLLLIKMILVIKDRIDYHKFKDGLQGADWAAHENPLYVTPQQDYNNVLYRQRSRPVVQQQQS